MDVPTGKMIRFLETGDVPEGLFRPDVFLDPSSRNSGTARGSSGTHGR
jgi:hypothetical protein